MSSPARRPLIRSNWTQKASRRLIPRSTKISFGPTTSSLGNENTKNYAAVHAQNNTSQTRQGNIPSSRNMFDYTPATERNAELKAARVPSREEEYRTPTPRWLAPPRLSPELAQKYAAISAASNDPIHMRSTIVENATLSRNAKRALIDKLRYEYNSSNFKNYWNSLPSDVIPQKTRKSRKSRKSRTRKN